MAKEEACSCGGPGLYDHEIDGQHYCLCAECHNVLDRIMLNVFGIPIAQAVLKSYPDKEGKVWYADRAKKETPLFPEEAPVFYTEIREFSNEVRREPPPEFNTKEQ